MTFFSVEYHEFNGGIYGVLRIHPEVRQKYAGERLEAGNHSMHDPLVHELDQAAVAIVLDPSATD